MYRFLLALSVFLILLSVSQSIAEPRTVKLSSLTADDLSEADRKRFLIGTLNNYLYDLDRYNKHEAFVEISKIFKHEDMPKIKAFGLAYFVGDRVDRDYSIASSFLMAAYLSSHRFYATRFGKNGENGAAPFSDLELDILAFSAYQTATGVFKSKPSKHQLFYSQMHHDFAAEAGSQLSKLAIAYIFRNIAPSKMSSQILTEHRLFQEASNCTQERLERELTPWLLEICEIAKNEVKISAERERAHLDAKGNVYNAWADRVIASGEISSIEFDRKSKLTEQFANGLIVSVKTIILEAARNPQRQERITNQFEEHQKWIQERENSTWGHIGAALLVP